MINTDKRSAIEIKAELLVFCEVPAGSSFPDFADLRRFQRISVFRKLFRMIVRCRKAAQRGKLTPKYIYSTLRTDLTMSYDTGSADLYYVYGKGKLIAILSSPAEAVQLADENVGVVLNSSQSYVWERGNRQQGMRLDETTMPSGFQSASLDENVLKESLGDDYELLNLTGCTREEILYMISSGYGVVVKTGANESLLLTGYDIFGNSWLYNPATGETTALSDDDSDALFAQNGNVFISYIKKVKIE